MYSICFLMMGMLDLLFTECSRQLEFQAFRNCLAGIGTEFDHNWDICWTVCYAGLTP